MIATLAWVTSTLLLLSSTQLPPESDKTVVWALNEAPPFHMAAGPERGQGFCEKLVAAAIRATPELTHEVNYVPNLRVEMLWQNNHNLCFPCMIHRDPPQASVIYSDITHQYPPHGLITRAAIANQLIAEFGNPIDLLALSQSDRYRFVQPAGRGYGVLQQMVDSYLLSSLKTTVLTGDHGTASMFAMIASERVDFTIDYPFVMDYFVKDNPTAFEFVPILQNYQQQLSNAMACTDNPWGYQVIDRLNTQMERIRTDAAFVEALDRWLPQRPQLNQQQ